MLRLRGWTVGILCFFMVGCASFGPLHTADLEPTLRRDVPSIQGELIDQAPASLFYAIDGFSLSDAAKVASPLLAQGRWLEGPGIVVLTEEKLYFVKWLQEKYEHKWDLNYPRIRSIEVRSWGKGRRLVLKLDGEPEVVSFEITTASGNMIDKEKTVAVCQLIAQRVGTECTLPL
jgi:hypothetical protein